MMTLYHIRACVLARVAANSGREAFAIFQQNISYRGSKREGIISVSPYVFVSDYSGRDDDGTVYLKNNEVTETPASE